MRQAGDIYLIGKQIGLYENGVTAYGIDISNAVQFGGQENVLAVKVDNRTTYTERATGTTFQWNANDFNPDHGGINRHVWLHIMGKIYLDTELGINRVAVRSTLMPGTVTVSASRAGLKPAQVQIVSKPVDVKDGVATWLPQHLQGPAEG